MAYNCRDGWPTIAEIHIDDLPLNGKRVDDLPLNGKRVTINILNRKMFCLNPNCNHKTFSENFDFVEKRAKKTIRLKNHIVDISVNMSSISAQNLLRKSGIKIGKSTICTFLKKR